MNGAVRRQQLERLAKQMQPQPHRLGEQRQSRHDRGGWLLQQAAEQAAQTIGVALHDGGGGTGRASQVDQNAGEFDQDEAFPARSPRPPGLVHRPVPVAELDHRPDHARIRR